MKIIVWNTKSLSEKENEPAFPYSMRSFRNKVREAFSVFATIGMSDDQIKYLDLHRDYEKLI